MEPVVVTEVYNAPIDKVWAALTDKDAMKNWYFDIPNFLLRKGAVFDFFEPGDNKKYYHRCQILDFELNKFLHYTWTHPNHSKGSSDLLWTLEDLGATTKLSIQHKGLENLADAGKDFQKSNYEEGWKTILGKSLKKYLEEK